MKVTILTALAAIAAAAIALPAAARADPPPPCSDGQVQVGNGGQQAASGHREIVLVFSLAPGAQECSLTGYPGVDSGAGGPLIHATRTMAGFMGGLRDTDGPPTIPVTAITPGRAVVEGVAVDKSDPNLECPTYTELLVTAPDTTNAVTVPVDIDTCELQVHPIGSAAADSTYHEHSENAQYTIDITYPLGYPDMKSVSDFVAGDRTEFVDWVAEVGSDGRNRRYVYDVRATTYSSAQPASTSLVLTIDNDTGGAHQGHPATSFKAFNFDVEKQTPITFDTLFKPDAKPLEVLTPMARKLYDAPMLELAPSDFGNFALTDDAVVFFFGEGQLMPADNTGPRQISVPRKELAPLLA
ncbi:DUF4232 domain-containing protein [Mycolicibacterium stellerae]|uniref:DUF4232 domain-containing protein n=1 Tax=Mycolicibacterium stellerae TaxID=2358193 RepID=UPI000F0B50F0|nr:DUF4232 domain-containing protein [Mycolicibacterium stellerae]